MPVLETPLLLLALATFGASFHDRAVDPGPSRRAGMVPDWHVLPTSAPTLRAGA
jgi:hypothetical protein